MADLGEKPLWFGLKMIRKAGDERLRQQAWDLWLMLYPNWDKKDRVQFPEFLKRIKGPDVKPSKYKLTDDDIERYCDLADLVRHR